MLCAQVFDHPALRKAKASVDKAELFKRRAPLWLQRCRLDCVSGTWHVRMGCSRSHVEELLKLGGENPEYKSYSLLFLLAYVFLLRLPSEAVPVRAVSGDQCLTCQGDLSVLFVCCASGDKSGLTR